MTSTLTGKIRVLSDSVSCQIAAGEVVERPASVVKELIENSLDARSSLISVEVEDGGRRLILIRDNGEGMNREDAQLACQRFATSKLQVEQDLESLTTLGFRGEALPSIASISKFRLQTQPHDADTGTEVYAEGGLDWTTQDYAGAPGTHIEVRDLFFNTPGRQKFLKSASTEFSKICHVVQQAAAVHPHVHFQLSHKQQKVLEYPKTESIKDRLLQIYGRPFTERFLPIQSQTDALNLTGFIVSPNHARSSRTPQDIFVNGRPIKNVTVLHAVQEAYRSLLPKGRHPQFILFLTLAPNFLDVNVHPTKREVRFSRQEIVHSGVLRALRETLATSSAPPEITTSSQALMTYDQQSFPKKPTVQSLTVSPDFSQFGGSSPTKGEKPSSALSLFVQEPPETYTSPSDQPQIYALGQVHHTYLVGQINEDVYIVDQHTAHERILFERLIRSWKKKEIPRQPLLIPEPLDLPPHQCEALDEWLPHLAQCGLELERFGPQAFVARAIPSALGSVSVSGLVAELLEELSEWRSHDALDKLIHPIFATMACQSAVQAGRTMTVPEITELLHDWAQEQFPMTCPHGRRIAITHSFDELNTLFSRPSL